MEDKPQVELPEAPLSITVKGYYQGFSVSITKRSLTGEVELGKITKAIDNMVAKGFKPSWNEDTNGQHGKKYPKPPKSPVEKKMQEGCPHQFTAILQVKTGENQGRYYYKCNDCGAFVRWAKVE